MTEENSSGSRVIVGAANSDAFPDRLKMAIARIGGVGKTARIAGVAESTVRKWRDGESEPQRPYLAPIANAADMDLRWFVSGVGQMDHGAAVAEDRGLYQLFAGPESVRLLGYALDMVERAADERGLDLSASKRAKIALLLLEHIASDPKAAADAYLQALVDLTAD